MKLRSVKLTKDTKCKKCGYDLKATWDVYADEKNEVYCRYCAPKIDESTTPVQLEMLNALRYMIPKPSQGSSPQGDGPF